MKIAESISESKAVKLDIDPMLQALAAVPERSSLELGITLNVHGVIITGFMISQSTYFDSLIEDIGTINEASQEEQEVKATLQDFLSQLKDKLESEQQKSDDHRNSKKQTLPRFIHLRNVKIYPSEGKGLPTYGDALWRGHLASVNGFTLGEMVPAKFENITPPI